MHEDTFSISDRARTAMRGIARDAYYRSRDSWEEVKHRMRDRKVNAERRASYSHHTPSLSVVQRRIVDDVAKNGYATATFAELFQDSPLWSEIERRADAFALGPEVRSRTEKYQAGEKAGAFAAKEFLVRMYPEHPTVPVDDFWLQLGLHPAILDISNSYLELFSRLHYLDLWYSIPEGENPARESSQNWHRDHEDQKLLKVFMYLSDVTPAAGPLEYVPGSHRSGGGLYSDLWTGRSRLYPPLDHFSRLVPEDARKTFTGKKGTIVFCDTTGFHRGGLATLSPRVVANWIYVTAAAFTSKRLVIDRGGAPLSLSPAALLATH